MVAKNVKNTHAELVVLHEWPSRESRLPCGFFKRQMKLCERRGYDMEQLRTAIRILSTEDKLPAEYLPHMLHGDR